jgi:hypothetical protein
MSSFPCLTPFVSGSGQVRYRLGDRLVDRYVEFVAYRGSPGSGGGISAGSRASGT